jgi:hypothetical protein
MVVVHSANTKNSETPVIEYHKLKWLSSIKLYYSKKMWNFVFNYNKND